MGPYRFFFFAGDRGEPPHVHIEHDHAVAKFWVNPVRFDSSGGFSRKELNQIRGHVEHNQELLLRSWNDYVGS